jgi:geranylgeranyl diphosphate synthase type II
MRLDFRQVLAQKRALVWKEIDKYLKTPVFKGKMALGQNYQSLLDFHWRMVRAYPERQGKYLRPTLLLLTAEAMGSLIQKALKTAAAMQTSEDWLLVHDDWEDDSLQRRGEPALHRLYSKELANNAGDGLHVVMWQILWDNLTVLGPKKAKEVADEFAQMLTRTVLGQTIEIKWTQENCQKLTDEDIFLILDGKTSYYTIAGPMRLGAIIAGATPKQLGVLWEFGQHLGRCFQIVDDLLDLTSDFKGLKKQTGNDIYEGKRTIMLMHLLRTLKGKDKERAAEILAKSRELKTEAEVAWIIEKMKEEGSLDYGRRTAEDLATKAKETFEKKLNFLDKQPARDQLKAGIDFVLKRDH